MKDYERIGDLIPENISQLKGYVEEYHSGDKCLHRKSQAVIEKFMRKLYSKYNSWVTGGILRWKENETPINVIQEELDGAVKHFGPQSSEKVKLSIEQVDKDFKEKGQFDRKSAISETFYQCADKILDESSCSLYDFANKVEKEKEASKQNISNF